MPNLTNAKGIYAIVNSISGKVYVGSTTQTFRQRWNSHKSALHRGIHENPHLQCAWIKYNASAFEFIILEYVNNPNIIIEREQYWLDEFRLICEVYNMGTVAQSPSQGRHHSEEYKRKMSEARKGIGNPMYGRPISEEHRRRLSEARKNRLVTEETRQKLSEAHSGENHWNYGKSTPEETRGKISETLRGRIISEETRLKKSKPYPAFINLDTNEVIPAGVNLSALCREYGLFRSNMHKVIAGTQSHHRSWIVLDALREVG